MLWTTATLGKAMGSSRAYSVIASKESHLIDVTEVTAKDTIFNPYTCSWLGGKILLSYYNEIYTIRKVHVSCILYTLNVK